VKLDGKIVVGILPLHLAASQSRVKQALVKLDGKIVVGILPLHLAASQSRVKQALVKPREIRKVSQRRSWVSQSRVKQALVKQRGELKIIIKVQTV